jgi:hypothetical protein
MTYNGSVAFNVHSLCLDREAQVMLESGIKVMLAA